MRQYYCLTIISIFALVPFARADEPAAEGKTYVLLVAVSKHANERLDRGVENTVRDAELLRTTLQQRAGIPADQFLELTSQTDAERKPTLENLRKQIPAFFGKMEAKDRLIVFFSGHGDIRNEKAYLVPTDVDLKTIETTGFPMAEA